MFAPYVTDNFHQMCLKKKNVMSEYTENVWLVNWKSVDTKGLLKGQRSDGNGINFWSISVHILQVKWAHDMRFHPPAITWLVTNIETL